MISIGLAGAALAVTAGSLLWGKRPDTREKELRRLTQLYRGGRIVEGFVDDIHGSVITYRYSISGVGYAAAQDLSFFPELSEEALQLLPGSVSIKYERTRPSNSMVYCPQWSGLRIALHAAQPETTITGG